MPCQLQNRGDSRKYDPVLTNPAEIAFGRCGSDVPGTRLLFDASAEVRIAIPSQIDIVEMHLCLARCVSRCGELLR